MSGVHCLRSNDTISVLRIAIDDVSRTRNSGVRAPGLSFLLQIQTDCHEILNVPSGVPVVVVVDEISRLGFSGGSDLDLIVG